MAGRPITGKQAELYMAHRERLGQAGAAAKAGFSERTARRLDGRGGSLPERTRRDWRTREDPFFEVWESELVPLLVREEGRLEATALLSHLQCLHPGRYPDSLLRTLQRRLASWRVRHGPSPTLIFPQAEEPGRIGSSDFTHATSLGVTVDGEAYPHLLYHFRLGYSGWSWVRVVEGGETFAALAEGLSGAVAALGGVPQIHRTDSLSAAFRNLSKDAAEDQTAAYAQLVRDLGMRPTRNNPGESHENGAIESPHGHLKRRIDQALRLRGSRDFPDRAAYRAWLDDLVAGIVARLDPHRLGAERAALKPLPDRCPEVAAFGRELFVCVTSGATITINKALYTVPDRLKGRRLRVVIFDDRIECFHQGELVEILPRLPRQGDLRQRMINYHHIIESLARKPGAFPRLAYRDQVHPNATWRATWEALSAALDERAAGRIYLGLLLLAHRAGCEQELTTVLAEHLAAGRLPELEGLRARLMPPAATEPPPIVVLIPDASSYDRLLGAVWSQAS